MATEYKPVYLSGDGTSANPYVVSGVFQPEPNAYYAAAYQSGTHRLYVFKNGAHPATGTNIGVSGSSWQEDGVVSIPSNNNPVQFTLSDYTGFKFFENAAPYSGSGTLADPYVIRSGGRLSLTSSEKYIKPLSKDFTFYLGLYPSSPWTLKAYYLDGTSESFTYNVNAGWQSNASRALENVDYISLKTSNNNISLDFGIEYSFSTVSVDLSSLEDWGDVTTGSHTLKVKAKGTGYRDSELSTGVSFSKAASGYTVTVQQSPDSYPTGGDATEVYDGQDASGTLVGTIAAEDFTSHTYTISSGYIWLWNGSGGTYDSVTGGVAFLDSSSGMTFTVSGDGAINGFAFACLTGDTLITMADGSAKRLDEIELGDEVLSMDWATKELISRKVIYTDKDEGKSFGEFDRWIFEDGSEIKTVHRHEFYNDEKGGMAYMDEWNIGDHAYRIDGAKVALVKHETVKEEVRHYKISLEGDTNFFANGLLNGDRNCPKERL